jgi:hypothetical protein
MLIEPIDPPEARCGRRGVVPPGLLFRSGTAASPAAATPGSVAAVMLAVPLRPSR